MKLRTFYWLPPTPTSDFDRRLPTRDSLSTEWLTDWLTDCWIAAAPRHHSDSRFRVPRDSWSCLLSIGFGSLQNCSLSTRLVSSLYSLCADRTENTASKNSSIVNDVLSGLLPSEGPGIDAGASFWLTWKHVCRPFSSNRRLFLKYFCFQPSRHNILKVFIFYCLGFQSFMSVKKIAALWIVL
jgi:hypothetical protein